MMKAKIGVVFGFILISLFLISFISSWSDTGQASQNVSGCGNLTTSGSLYTLNQSISAIGNCFNITSDNIVFNLNNYSIIGDYSADRHGIFIHGRNNVTVKNGTIQNFGQVFSGGSGIYLRTTINSFFYNINVSNTDSGIYFSSSSSSNSFSNVSGFNNTFGLYLDSSSNNTFYNTFLAYSISYGVWFSTVCLNNRFYNLTTAYNNGPGVYLRSSSSNLFYNITSNSDKYGTYIYSAGISTNQRSKNNTFVNFYTINETNFSIYSNNWSFSSGNSLVYNFTYGQISFSPLNNTVYSNLSFGDKSSIVVYNNSAIFNSSFIPELTRSNVTLTGLSTSMLNPQLMKDGSTCVDCYNFTSLNAGTVVFNISSGGNYSIQDVPDLSMLTTCKVLNISGMVYRLMNNVSNSGDNCFNITADNITLQGNGYSIIGTGVADDFNGIYAAGRKNITLKNFKVYNFVINVLSGSGIYLFNTNNSNIENISAYSNTIGIRLYSSYNNNLKNNTIYSNSNGFYLQFSKNNNLYNNSISLNTLRGVALLDTSNTNSIFSNQIFSNNIGFSLDQSTNYLWNNNLYSNTYSIAGNNYPSIIYLTYNNSFGQINFENFFDFYSASITNDMSFPGNIRVENNSVYVNSTALPELNVSANVTLNGLPTNMVSPKIMKDGVVCSDCSNFTDLNAGTVTFSVTGFSNYSIADSFDPSNLTACGVLNRANNVYTLRNNVNTTGTCFNITGDNIVLDGNGYTLTFNTAFIDNSVGIFITGTRNNLTIKNFNNGILAIANGTFFGSNNIRGIYADSLISNSTFFNNNISLSTSSSYPFSFGSTYGIWISNASFNNFTNNQISDSMGYSFVLGTSYVNYFYNNSFSSFSKSGFSSSVLDIFSDNYFSSNGIDWAALSFDSISNSTFFNNTLISLGNSLEAGASSYSNFSGNSISSTGGLGIYSTSSLYDSFYNNSFGGDTDGVNFVNANFLLFSENSVVSGTGDSLVFNFVNNSILRNNYFDKRWGQEIHGNKASINFIILPANLTLIYNNIRGQILYSNFTTSIYSDILWGLAGWNELIITNNSIHINTTSLSELNISANVTFYNNNYIGQYPLRFLKIGKDGVICNFSIGCYNYTSFEANTVTFNVSDFGAGNITLGKFVSSFSQQNLNVGWNSISLTLQNNDTVLERNISVNSGWNLIGYSSSTPLLYSNIGFTNSSGFYYPNWTSAVLSGKVQNNIIYYSDNITSSYPRYVPYDDSYLRPEKSYWFYLNESGNITIPGVYGSVLGDSYNTNDMMFRNSSGLELNITDAANANWFGGNNLIYFWNSTSSLFENVSLFNQNLNSWGGYFIRSQQSNLTLIRQD